MKYTDVKYKRTLTEAMVDPAIETSFLDMLPSLGDSVPVKNFSARVTPALTAMQYLTSYSKLYDLYTLAAKNIKLQSLILSALLIMQGVTTSDELDSSTIDSFISELADKVSAIIQPPTSINPATSRA